MATKKRPSTTKRTRSPRTLSIDVGGSGLKASVLNGSGEMVADRVRLSTPKPATPEAVMNTLAEIVGQLPSFSRISAGFPGVVREGVAKTAPNLGTDAWRDFDLAQSLTDRFGKPARVVNDADMQGLAAIKGEGIEFLVTLGTGFGTALFRDGTLMPHLEIGQHPARNGMNYDQYVGDRARRDVGKKRWNKRVRRALDNLRTLVTWDYLHIGGGNAKKLDFELPDDARLVDNRLGILGGVALWERSVS